MRYCRTKVAAPAVAGVAIEVPLYSMYQLFDQPEDACSASWERHERTPSPGPTKSGLSRPSSVGPRLLQ